MRESENFLMSAFLGKAYISDCITWGDFKPLTYWAKAGVPLTKMHLKNINNIFISKAKKLNKIYKGIQYADS